MPPCIHYRPSEQYGMSCPKRKIAMPEKEAEEFCKTCFAREEE